MVLALNQKRGHDIACLLELPQYQTQAFVGFSCRCVLLLGLIESECLVCFGQKHVVTGGLAMSPLCSHQ